MRYAIIDIGTNSIRYMLADYVNGNITSLYRDRENTRLGKGLYDNKNILCDDRMLASANAVAGFVAHARVNFADKTVCIATSAVRDASNKYIFASMLKNIADVELRILSGNEEAFLGFNGALGNCKDNNTILIDIGGGSTEIVERTPNGEIKGNSFNCGCVRSAETFGEDYSAARAFVEKTLKIPENKNVLLVGGTASTLAMIYKKLPKYDESKLHMTVIPSEYIAKLKDQILAMSRSEREKLCFFDPKRADILPFGLIILSHIIAVSKSEYVITSEEGLMHGIIRFDAKGLT